MNKILFSFLTLALFTNVDAAKSKKRNYNYSEVDAVTTIKTMLNKALHDFLEHNPMLGSETALMTNQEDDTLASLMSQISLASEANESNKRGRTQTENPRVVEEVDPIDGIKASCLALLSTDTLTLHEFAEKFEKISALIKSILNSIIHTEAKKALSQITSESEVLENKHLTEVIIPGLVFAQLLSNMLNKAGTDGKDGNLDRTVDYLILSATITSSLMKIVHQANTTGVTAFNHMGNQAVDMATLLDTFKALLIFFAEGLPLIAGCTAIQV
jgi:hypothetical protein